LVMCVC